MATDSPARVPVRPALLVGSAGALLIAGTAGLWAWYGTAVFFEILRTGWLGCF